MTDYCIEKGCALPACGERFVGVTEDGIVIVEMVCGEHLTTFPYTAPMVEAADVKLTDDAVLFSALLEIVYWGPHGTVRLEHHGSHASRDVICIGERVYGVDNDDDRRKLIAYATRIRLRQANTPIEPLP